MKRLFIILSTLTLSLIALSGCKMFDDPAFPESSAQRVQNIIDETFETLTSWEEGWYFNIYQGVEEDNEIGGFWFLCKFKTDYTVEAAAEIDVVGSPKGSSKVSGFELIRGRGAVLSFSDFNPIIHFLATPNFATPNGFEFDYEFTIVEVTPDLVTVKGIKTGKIMHLYKKTDGKSISDAMNDLATIGNRTGRSKVFTTTVEGAYVSDEFGYVSKATRGNLAVTSTRTYDATLNDYNINLFGAIVARIINIEYDVFVRMEQGYLPGSHELQEVPVTEYKSVKINYTPSLDGTRLNLCEPITVMDKEITSFVYDEATETFISDDPGNTVKLKEQIIPEVTIDDIIGTYTVSGRSNFYGEVTFRNVTIRKKEDSNNLVTITGVVSSQYKFDAMFDANSRSLVAQTGQDTGAVEEDEQGGVHKVMFRVDGTAAIFDIWGPGNITITNQEWGFFLPTYFDGAGAWSDLLSNVTFTRNT